MSAILTAALAASQPSLHLNAPAIRMSMIEEINSIQSTWKASVPVRFQNATVGDVMRLLGTVLPGDEGYLELPEKTHFKLEADAIPESFDVRTNWPQCSSITGRVRDQSNCGSCTQRISSSSFVTFLD